MTALVTLLAALLVTYILTRGQVPALAASPGCTEQHCTANACQEAKAVGNIPNWSHHGQRRRAVRGC